MKVTLRDYQQAAFDKARDAVRNGARRILIDLRSYGWRQDGSCIGAYGNGQGEGQSCIVRG